MSDEERKVIEELKNKKADYFMISNLTGKILLNLIEKQQKEIEDLKETLKCTQNSWFEDTQKIEEMKKQIDLDNECEIALNSKVMDLEKEIEELKNADLTTVYLNGVYDGEKKVEDKIKAKIDEVCESTIEESNVDILYSLLEKE